MWPVTLYNDYIKLHKIHVVAKYSQKTYIYIKHAVSVYVLIVYIYIYTHVRVCVCLCNTLCYIDLLIPHNVIFSPIFYITGACMRVKNRHNESMIMSLIFSEM